jgi:hypothetical protein
MAGAAEAELLLAPTVLLWSVETEGPDPPAAPWSGHRLAATAQAPQTANARALEWTLKEEGLWEIAFFASS